MKLVDILHRFRQSQNNSYLPNQLITAAIVQVLQNNRLVGEVLVQLPRRLDPSLKATMGLRWQENQLQLVVNPERLAELRTDEIISLLEHEALHVIWQHPIRYRNHRELELVRVATDVAVNQYLTEPPAGTVTLDQLQRLLKEKIPAKLDSHDYLRILEKSTPTQQERLQHAGIRFHGKQKGQAPSEGNHPLDTHEGWQMKEALNSQNGNLQLRIANIRQILTTAWHETPQRDRGLLPGNIVAQLQSTARPRSIKWQRILRQQFGLLAKGVQASHARFNRRQPLRMDLPGTVTNLMPAVDIFIDNSGSVSDEELTQGLATINKMLKKYRLPAILYSFDAKVVAKEKVNGKRVKLVRHGGGGTSFQCIFDYLHQHHISRQGRIIIIITDGWGEKKLRTYHYRNVYWLLLTSADQLSVEIPPGRVLEMERGN